MLTIYKNDSTKINRNERLVSVEIRGLSTDTKPIQFEGKKTSIVDNGSTFIKMDTGKVYMYDLEHKKWLYPGEEEEKVKSISFENNSYTIIGSGTITSSNLNAINNTGTLQINFTGTIRDTDSSDSGTAILNSGTLNVNRSLQ